MRPTERAISSVIRTLACAAVLLSVLPAPAQSQSQPQTIPPAARAAHHLQGRGLSSGSANPAAALEAARQQHQAMAAMPRAASLTAAWTPLGPAQVASQTYGAVTGRVTALALDPTDPTGNTLYLGSTGGGVWKSTNAAGAAAAVAFSPLTDTLSVFNAGAGSSTTASLSIGALAVSPTGVVLAGTGDPNDATDSYYGAGLLRSADGGLTWTLATGSSDGVAGNHTFFGLSFAGLAFSTANPQLAVAAVSTSAEGQAVNAPDQTYSLPGLYYSPDAGITWHLASILDGPQTVQAPGRAASGPAPAATAVVWNAARQLFLAAVRAHGYYSSPDGITWTRLAHQPGTALTIANCPANPASAACPIFRGALAVQPATGDTFALTTDSGNLDQGLYQDSCLLTGSQCASPTVLFATALNATPLAAGSGSKAVAQADYNLTLAAAPAGQDTVLFAGTVDLYRCTLASGCTLRNTTNAQNGCLHAAGVAPAQHALLSVPGASAPLLYLGNDGGLYRSTDGVNQQQPACSADDATHFQNLNPALGSLAEVVSFAQDPVQPAVVLAGLGALGTAGTASAAGAGGNVTAWPQLATGEGGTVAIDQTTPANWYLSTGAGVSLAHCGSGSSCTASAFTATVGEPQVASDSALIHAPWLLDPAYPDNVLLGTCRAWRGPAANGALWSAANDLSRPFGAPTASACSATFPLVQSLAAAGPAATSSNAQSAGSDVLYAGLEGSYANGPALGGHLFVQTSANLAGNTIAWRDAALAPVTNDAIDAHLFNPGGFDLSSLTADPHDATGATIYATVLGFEANGINTPHLYGSRDAGAHWLNLSANLPNAPANAVLVDPNDANTVYLALDTGVYVTTQITACATTNCWSIFGTALPNAPIVSLAASSTLPTGDGRVGLLRAGTYGRGIWSIPLLNAITPAAAAITINPAAAVFAASPVGSAGGSQVFTVTNTGNAPLTISSVIASGDFTETNTCLGQGLAQGSACSATVTFLPAAIGVRTGLLTVYGNVPGGQATAALSGSGTAPAAIVLTPASLIFPQTTVGQTSFPQNITISNTGGTTATLQPAVLTGDFALQTNTCGLTLAPQTGCTIAIVFTPNATGTRTGTLSVTDTQTTGGTSATQVASLSGSGVAPPTDTLSAVALSFPAQQVGTISTARQITLTNSGDTVLTLINAQITAGDFTVANACGNSLPGHSTCALSIAFAPRTAAGESGQLTISDQFRTQTVALRGIGLAPAGVSLLPVGGLAFGSIGLGQTSSAQTVTLTNNGGVALAISGLGTTGDFALVTGTNSCGQALAPGAVCTVSVVFTPGAPGSRTGMLTVTDSAVNSPQSLALMGTGTDFTLAADGPITATIRSGQTASYLLLLSSAAGLNGSVPLTCSGVPANAICSVSPSSGTLGGTEVITVTVSTGLSTVRLDQPAHPGMPSNPLTFAFAGTLFAGLLLPAMRRRGRERLALGLMLSAALIGMAGCSAARTIPAGTGTASTIVTPSGTYNLVVAGSSAGLVRSVALTLIVQ